MSIRSSAPPEPWNRKCLAGFEHDRYVSEKGTIDCLRRFVEQCTTLLVQCRQPRTAGTCELNLNTRSCSRRYIGQDGTLHHINIERNNTRSSHEQSSARGVCLPNGTEIAAKQRPTESMMYAGRETYALKLPPLSHQEHARQIYTSILPSKRSLSGVIS